MAEKPDIKIPEKPDPGGGQREYDPASRPQQPGPATPAPTPQPRRTSEPHGLAEALLPLFAPAAVAQG